MAKISTASGRYFNFLDPDPASISVIDIATALSNTCRFGGHCERFYSVAEHSVYASRLVAPEFAFEALMHDAAEAYTGDIPSPFKAILPDFAEIERRVENAVARKFELPRTMSPEVRAVDAQLLCAEKVQVQGNHDTWPSIEGVSPAPVQVQFWHPKRAKAEFLLRFNLLSV